MLSKNKGELSANINESAEDVKTYSYTSREEDKAQTFVMDVRGIYALTRVFGAADFSTITDVLQKVSFNRVKEVIQVP